jgi:hypothetical protein
MYHRSCALTFYYYYCYYFSNSLYSAKFHESRPCSLTSKCLPASVRHIQTAKVKQSRYTPWWRLGGEEYSSYSFLTSALDGGEWSASRPGRALHPGKGPPVRIVQEAGWAPEPVWTQRLEEKSFATAGDRTPVSRSSSP